MILKFVKLNKCILCSKVISQTLSRKIFAREISLNSHLKSDDESHRSSFTTSYGKRIRKVVVTVNQKHIEAVKAVLKKYNVDKNNLEDESDIFLDTPWAIEKKIMLLEEIGVPEITTDFILFLQQGLQLPVDSFKAHLKIKPRQSIAKKLFSYANDNFDLEAIGIDEKLLTKKYLHLCLLHFMQRTLNLNQTQVNAIKNRKDNKYMFHSIRLFSKTLHFLQYDIMLSKSKILKHYSWLCLLHPDQLQTTYNLVAEIANEHTPLIARRYPPIFEHDLEDLRLIVSFIKRLEISSKSIISNSIVRIFQITSEELERRYEYLSKNLYTQVFLKHPRFLTLIAYYHTTLPRLRYLEENNLKYATIYSLTTYSNYQEELVTIRKLNLNDIKSFFDVHFGDKSQEVLQKFKRHAFYKFVPLVSMKESYLYLQGIFFDEVIREHIYAILYNQLDLQAAYEVVMKDPDHSKLPPNQLLTMCLYTIEVNSHFTGDPVLAPGKYAESLKETVDQDKKISDTKE